MMKARDEHGAKQRPDKDRYDHENIPAFLK